jgi:L-ascorbate metabolism protein UlaG (beta-lactamase superfamily)
MNFTYYGHACFAVEIGNRTLLFDPFISPNPQAKAIDLQSVKADYILVSHGHSKRLS